MARLPPGKAPVCGLCAAVLFSHLPEGRLLDFEYRCISSDRETTEHEPDEGCAPAWGMEMQGGALKSKVVVKKGGTTILQGGLYTGSG